MYPNSTTTTTPTSALIPIIVDIKIHHGGSFNREFTTYAGGREASFPGVDVSDMDLMKLFVWVKEKINVEYSDILYFKQGEDEAAWLRSDPAWVDLRSSASIINLYPTLVDWDSLIYDLYY